MRAGTLLFLPFFAAVSNALIFTLPSTSLTAGAVTLTYASEASDPAGELTIWLGPVGSTSARQLFAAADKVPATKVGETATIQVAVSAEAADGDNWEFAAGPASPRPTSLFAKSDPFTVNVAGAVNNAANSAGASAQQSQSQSQSQSASTSSAQPSLSTPSALPSKSSASAPASVSSPASAPPAEPETSAPPATETTAPPSPDANVALPSSPSNLSSASPSASPSSNPKVGNALGASAKSSSPPVGTIVGAIIGGLVGILLIIFLVIVYLRKRAWRNRLQEDLEKYSSDRNGNMFAPTANEYGGEKDGVGAAGLSRAPSLGYGQGAAQAQMQNPYPYTTYGSGYAGGYNA